MSTPAATGSFAVRLQPASDGLAQKGRRLHRRTSSYQIAGSARPSPAATGGLCRPTRWTTPTNCSTSTRDNSCHARSGRGLNPWLNGHRTAQRHERDRVHRTRAYAAHGGISRSATTAPPRHSPVTISAKGGTITERRSVNFSDSDDNTAGSATGAEKTPKSRPVVRLNVWDWHPTWKLNAAKTEPRFPPRS